VASCAVLLADGFEEIEAVTVIDVLRRAGIQVSVLGAGVQGSGAAARRAVGSHGIAINVDAALVDVAALDSRFDCVVLPGGLPGATNLRDNERVRDFVLAQHGGGALVAAICAAPIALGRFGLLQGRDATCYPGFEDQLVGARVHADRAVVVDERIVTSRGVGTALPFALALVERLVDAATAREHATRMLVA
jgi:4-methyl-5(b-hydroxyethyl)-thiazole monophosphate biosynthesis